ncbi:MAG TPA: hypothetical protein VKE74_10110 [Gemmataceae bacterium]|nr:hypothetical protein [Gemmataceae bacterium]
MRFAPPDADDQPQLGQRPDSRSNDAGVDAGRDLDQTPESVGSVLAVVEEVLEKRPLQLAEEVRPVCPEQPEGTIAAAVAFTRTRVVVNEGIE